MPFFFLVGGGGSVFLEHPLFPSWAFVALDCLCDAVFPFCPYTCSMDRAFDLGPISTLDISEMMSHRATSRMGLDLIS